ncbi:MAG: hypothetical protein QXP98_04320 [Thermoproteus sp.]
MKSIYILVAVLVVLTAVFAALWYGAYVENNLLKNQYASLQSQYSTLNTQYSALQSQYANLQNAVKALQNQYANLSAQYNSLQNQYSALQSQYANLQNQYSTLNAQYTSLQNQYANLQSQYSTLNAQYSALQSQYVSLQGKVEELQSYIYAGKNLVDDFKGMLQGLQLGAPTVGSSWTFTMTSSYQNLTLPPGYYRYRPLQLYTYYTLSVSVSDPTLKIMIMDPAQFQQYFQGGSASYLASGYGSVTFTPSQNGTYYVVVENDGTTTSTYSITYTIYETWYYCGPLQPACNEPYVTGVVGTPSYDFFRLFALYDYWFNHRQALAQAVLSVYPNLTTVQAYSLSLAALLKAAGFNVTFAAVSSSLVDPFKPDSVQVAVVFNSAIDPTNIFYNYFDTLPVRGNVITDTLPLSNNIYKFYVLIDTYYVHDIYDLNEPGSTRFNIIYLDGVTQLP